MTADDYDPAEDDDEEQRDDGATVSVSGTSQTTANYRRRLEGGKAFKRTHVDKIKEYVRTEMFWCNKVVTPKQLKDDFLYRVILEKKLGWKQDVMAEKLSDKVRDVMKTIITNTMTECRNRARKSIMDALGK